MRAVVGAFVGVLAYKAENLPAQALALPYWQHSQWVGENAPPGTGRLKLRRSGDGYLWFGTTNGMIRFDGIRFTIMDSTNTPAFRGLTQGGFVTELVDRRGVLWIHGPGGSVFTYADGVVNTVFRQESEATGLIEEDGAGRLYIVTRRGIRRIDNGQLVASGLPAEVPDTGIFGVRRDSSDGLWIGTSHNGLLHVQGSRVDRFANGRVRALLQSRDGVLWAIGEGLGNGPGLWRLVAGRWSEVHPPGEPSRSILSRVGVEASDGSVWFITADMGLLRWHNGRIEQFSKADGLSSNRVHDVYADSEGVVWVTTDAGLDRLRPSVFASIEKRNGLPFDGGDNFAEDSGGAIWMSSKQWAHRLDGGIIRNRPEAVTSERVFLSDDSYHQLIASSRSGGVWLGSGAGGILRVAVKGPPVFRASNGFPKRRSGMAFESRDGTLWVSSIAGEVGSFRDGKYKAFPVSNIGKQIGVIFTEDAFDRMWFAIDQRRVIVLAGDSVVSNFVLPGSSGTVTSLAAEAGDTMWASTSSTLIRIVGQQAVEVTPPGLQRLMSAEAELAVSHGSLWLSSTGGFARIPLSELHRAADVGAPISSAEIFGTLDGVTIAHAPTQVLPTIRVGKDGRVWVATPNGLAVADPAFRMTIKHPRKVLIEEFSVGSSAMVVRNGEKIAPLPARISFRFTVPTVLLAERVRMQYRLDGADDGWIDAAVPRIATYNQLRAGPYVFRVRAWDETGQQIPGEATLSFRVLPTWYQSWWFALFVILVIACILFMVYRLRVRQLTHAYNVRLEERWAERTRIARELHDTLLQSFQGLMFRFQAVREMLPAQPAAAIAVLDSALMKGEGAIDQARSAVSDLRSSEKVERDLNAGLAALAANAIQLCTHGTPPLWTLNTKGRIREIPPTVLYELYQIVQEALGNVCQHARAENVSVEVRYSIDSLRITVTDDGMGFDERLLASERRPGHFGVQGMMERVERLGGEMTLRSRPHEGTRVMLSVPANVAYRKVSSTNGVGTPLRSRKRRSDHE